MQIKKLLAWSSLDTLKPTYALAANVDLVVLRLEDNDCPVGVATQQNHLRRCIEIKKSAQQLVNFLHASTELMQVMARAYDHDHLSKFSIDDLTILKHEMSQMTGIQYGGIL